MASPPDSAPGKAKLYAGGTYKEVTLDDSATTYSHYKHAAHALIYADDKGKLWEGTQKRCSIMMSLRFDGALGFPGGFLDLDESGSREKPVVGLNRELEEEIALDTVKFGLKDTDHLMSHSNDHRQLVTHLYAKKVDAGDFAEIEKRVLASPDWGGETAGILRVPLYALKDGFRGLPIFLCQNFVGNAKEQLVEAIRRLHIIPEEEFTRHLRSHEEYMKTLEKV